MRFTMRGKDGATDRSCPSSAPGADMAVGQWSCAGCGAVSQRVAAWDNRQIRGWRQAGDATDARTYGITCQNPPTTPTTPTHPL